MEFGILKVDKFEIIAIFREELLRKTKLEIKYKSHSIITQLVKVASDCFVIGYKKGILITEKQDFIFHSEQGFISFNANFDHAISDDLESALVYFIPNMVFFLQRRQHQRFSFLTENSFLCSGRYKNGENYSLRIKDISSGGCALISLKLNPRFLYNGNSIKMALLDFGDFGKLQLDLKIVSVASIQEYDENYSLYSCYQISCKFNFRNSTEESGVEKIIIDYLTTKKLKK